MNVTFVWPEYLFAAAIVPALVLLGHGLLEARTRRKLRQLAALPLWREMLASVSYQKRWLRAALLALASSAVLLAFARPQGEAQTIEMERPTVDLIIGLDISRSMLAEDMNERSRLEVAKAGIAALLESARGSRAGLIAFAGEAFVSAPITSDIAALSRHVEALSPHLITRQGTDLAQAISLAATTFAKADYPTKVLMLVTDGEELQGEALQVARRAASEGLRVFTIGVGSTTGARVPVRDPDQPSRVRYAQNEFQREVISRLNEPMLRQLAASGGGAYTRLNQRGEGMTELWETFVRPLAKTTDTTTMEAAQEYFQWPLAAALVLLLAERLITDRKRPAT